MRLRRTAAVTAALLTLALGSCGEDETPASQDAPVDTSTTEPADGSATDPGDGENPFEALSEVEIPLDTIGTAVETAMGSVTGYSVDDDTLRLDVDGNLEADFASDCQIISMVAGSVDLPEGSTIVLRYSDGEQSCEAL